MFSLKRGHLTFDKINWKNTRVFVDLGGIFGSDNKVTYDRKQGILIFGKGVKFNFSPAALRG